MPEPVQARIRESIRAASFLYHQLVLLVGEPGSGKTEALRAFAGELGVDVINVNLALSAKLLELTTRQRALRLPTLLGDVLSSVAPVSLLDNTEILFDRHMKQDPLRLLQGMSRNHCVVASWNGHAAGSRLIYAEPGHAEYRNYETSDAMIVDMNELSGPDTQERELP